MKVNWFLLTPFSVCLSGQRLRKLVLPCLTRCLLKKRRRDDPGTAQTPGRVSIQSLESESSPNISAVTIRQDLRALEDGNLLERTYGGAAVSREKQHDSARTFVSRAFSQTPHRKVAVCGGSSRSC
ncbi:MAG: DeoR family transcriptional regulator [Chloroflexi bacterium]|nr:DeoR family transcriptional regulator [Chloroflexota bacterium]